MRELKKDWDFGDVLLVNFINLSESEKRSVLEYRNHENVRKWMYHEGPISLKDHLRFIETLKDDDKNFYWLAKAGKDHLGVVYLNRTDFENGNGYLGIYSGPLHREKGSGQLLIACLKKIAFSAGRLHTLKLEVIEDNERAINFYKKAGFKREGRLKEFVLRHGKRRDVVIMGTSREK